MDYGDDPLVSTYYAAEHARASRSAAPKRRGMLEDLIKRREWAGQSLEAMRDKAVTPEMLVAAGVKWDALQSRHGTDAALQFGFDWPTMLACGFTGRHLATLSHSQVAALGLTAARMLECRPRAEDVSALKMGATELRDLGWTADSIPGLHMRNMVGFGFSAQTWRDTMGVTDFGALGFQNYVECARAGWRTTDIQQAIQPAARPTTQVRSGVIRFI